MTPSLRLCVTAAPSLQQTIDHLIDCFARHDTESYFACFHPEARFVFHTVPDEVLSKAAYRQRWHQWELETGFQVLGCTSLAPQLSYYGDCAVLSHQVRTRLRSLEGELSLLERESIIFQQQQDGRWLCIHEHLSPLGAL